jgi:hypothetical protein
LLALFKYCPEFFGALDLAGAGGQKLTQLITAVCTLSRQMTLRVRALESGQT